jgi:hypothetical protein
MVVFDTAVENLMEELTDPVELLFGVQLGDDTDIHGCSPDKFPDLMAAALNKQDFGM